MTEEGREYPVTSSYILARQNLAVQHLFFIFSLDIRKAFVCDGPKHFSDVRFEVLSSVTCPRRIIEVFTSVFEVSLCLGGFATQRKVSGKLSPVLIRTIA